MERTSGCQETSAVDAKKGHRAAATNRVLQATQGDRKIGGKLQIRVDADAEKISV